MTTMRFLTLAVLGCVCAGCLSLPGAEANSLAAALQSRDRNDVHLALWTLQTNAISIPKEIDIQKPHEQSRPHIQNVVAYISRLPPAEQRALENSFRRHKRLYEPVFKRDKWK
jgi:hypothetical protein